MVFADNAIGTLALPEGVTTISPGAFQNNTLTSVSLPTTVENIFQLAFDGNTSLTGITLPVCRNSTGKYFTNWQDANAQTYSGGTTVIDFTIAYTAQFVSSIPYTLSDTDVTVSNGTITACSNTGGGTHITIPDTLQNQEVIGIDANVFSGIEQLTLPTPEKAIFISWLSGNGSTHAGGSSITDLTVSYTARFTYTLTNADVTVNNGTITACNNTGGGTHITIPDTLQNQEITGIDANVFAGIEQLTLPTPEKEIFTLWLSGSGTSHNGGTAITDLTTSYTAQFTTPVSYILTDADVTMEYGVVTACSNVNSANYVIMPDSLQGMELIGIEANVFKDMGILKLTLSSPQAYSFLQWQSGSGLVHQAGATVTDVLSSYSIVYDPNLPYTIQDKDVKMYGDGELTNGTYNFTSKNIIIPDTLQGMAVKAITASANFAEQGIITLQLPNTLEKIEAYTFVDNAIETLIIPEKYFEMGVAVFNGNAINEINGNPSNGIVYAINADGSTDSVTIVSYGGASKVVDFIPNKVKYINTEAFSYCDLNSITLPNDLLFLGQWALSDNNFTTLNFPGTSDWIDNSGIVYSAGSQITNFDNAYTLNISHTLTDADVTVQEGHITGFVNTLSASFITIPDTLLGQAIIGVRNDVFANKGIVKLTLPQHSNLPDFSGWLSLDAKNVNPTNGQYSLNNFIKSDINNNSYNLTYIAKLPSYTLTSMDVVMENGTIKANVFTFLVNEHYYSVDPPVLCYDTIDIPRNLIIPDVLDGQGVKSIGSRIFQNAGLKAVSLPASLNSIGYYSFAYNEMDSVVIPASVTSIGESAFRHYEEIYGGISKLKFENNSRLKTIGKSAFSGNNYLNQYLYLPDSVESIGDYAFQETGIDYIEFPKSIKTIGNRAFYHATIRGDGYLVWPSECKLRTIGEEAFAENIVIESDGGIYLPNISDNGFLGWKCIETGEILQGGAKTDNLTSGYVAQYEYTITDGNIVVENNYITATNYYFLGGSSYIIIPDTIDGQVVKGIAEQYGPYGVLLGIFENFKLKEVTLPSHLEYIANSCFSHNQLTEIDIPDMVVHIGYEAFIANNITSITLPNHTTTGFVGWIGNNHYTGIDSLIEKTNGEYIVTDFLYLSYTAAYEVIFRDHDGTILKTDTVKHYNDAIPLAPPVREGYSFTGWDKDYTNISRGLTLTAQYSQNGVNSYTVTFEDWNGNVLSTQTVAEGSDATAPTDPTRIGYTFTGWDDNFTNVTSNLTVTAQYTINSYTVTFNDWDGTELKTESVKHSSDATAPKDPTRIGYTFTGWDKDYTNISQGLTLTAQYSQNGVNSYTVTFEDWNGNVLSTQTVAEGSDAAAPTDPEREGYTFVDWDVNFTNVVSNLTVTAQYSITTSINTNHEKTVRIYPNPTTNGLLYIKSDEPINEINIYDLTGRKVFNSKNSANPINVSSLSNGVYLIKVDNITRRIIIN